MTQRLHHLPTALVASAVLLVVAVGVAWPIGDGTASLGAAAGVALVVLSYLVSSLVVVWVDAVARNLLLPVVLLTYALKFAVFGLVMYRVRETGWAGLRVMGVTVIVATVVWTGAQLYWILRAKTPYVEP
ncbi:hypothetical protein GCM10010399_32560 [Dactylosporangium fulvum]|uniref:ATP synthase protein I n=1 Tax=Dactylosporangium fulvum TaxID=53359 RepID=A0ABY5W205_9ACTN|nr:hypothetical protein [Dactylosporangium fulvum]UWP83950.1 hypothetical protein Dfulv_06765 [Dactylosporangium fulvum]